jgi:hypothetical protein
MTALAPLLLAIAAPWAAIGTLAVLVVIGRVRLDVRLGTGGRGTRAPAPGWTADPPTEDMGESS